MTSREKKSVTNVREVHKILIHTIFTTILEPTQINAYLTVQLIFYSDLVITTVLHIFLL